jgi:hypothetical protein
MAIDNGPLVHNSGEGTINVHGTVVGGNGNQVTVSQAAASTPGTGELLRVLTAIRLTAAASTDVPAHVQAQVIAGVAEAQRCVAAGEAAYAGAVLLRARAALEPAASPGAGTTAALCSLLDSALDLVSDGG